MGSVGKTRWGAGLLAVALIGFMALPCQAQTQADGTAEDWVSKLGGLDSPPDQDLAALRQQAMDRIKAKAKTDSAPLKRPPMRICRRSTEPLSVSPGSATPSPMRIPCNSPASW